MVEEAEPLIVTASSAGAGLPSSSNMFKTFLLVPYSSSHPFLDPGGVVGHGFERIIEDAVVNNGGKAMGDLLPWRMPYFPLLLQFGSMILGRICNLPQI